MELTAAQQALFPAFRAKYLAVGYKTSDPLKFDRKKAIQSVKDIYSTSGNTVPQNFYVGTWDECVAEAKRIQKATGKSTDIAGALSWGQCAAATACYARYFADVVGVQEIEHNANVLDAVCGSTGPSLFFAEAAFIATHPSETVKDDEGKIRFKWPDIKIGNWEETEVGGIDIMIARLRVANK
jgi:hypothetical protein